MVFSTSSFSVARGGHKKVLLLQRSIEITTTSSFLPTTKARVWLCGRRRRRRLQSRATRFGIWNSSFVSVSLRTIFCRLWGILKKSREREREREREALLFYLMKSERFVWPRDDEKRRDESFDFFLDRKKFLRG